MVAAVVNQSGQNLMTLRRLGLSPLEKLTFSYRHLAEAVISPDVELPAADIPLAIWALAKFDQVS